MSTIITINIEDFRINYYVYLNIEIDRYIYTKVYTRILSPTSPDENPVTDCPNSYRKYTANLYLSRCSTN